MLDERISGKSVSGEVQAVAGGGVPEKGVPGEGEGVPEGADSGEPRRVKLKSRV